MSEQRMKCSRGHTGLKVVVICEMENWIDITCLTCYECVYYNGA